VDILVYSRDAPAAGALREDEELLEEHWSYMDRFAESMIARGPTLGADLDTPTGSLHVLGLPDVEAAHSFVADEPNNRAGVYAEHSVWRFENLLGRTMWEFTGGTDEPKFLIFGLAPQDDRVRAARAKDLSTDLRGRLILYGALSTLDDARLVGIALAVQAPDEEAASALLGDPRLELPAFPEIEIHRWELGGRR
jgi:uncharacterized protein